MTTKSVFDGTIYLEDDNKEMTSMVKKKYLYLIVVFVLLLGVWGCDNDQSSVDKFSVSTAVVGEGEIIKTPFEVDSSSGSEVNLVASPADGWGFSHWEKDGDIYTQTLERSMDIVVESDISITAIFRPLDQILKLTVDGEGQVTENIATDSLDEKSEEGFVVEIIAKPSESWIFLGWLGLPVNQQYNNPIIIDKHQNLDITAVFVKSDYTLSLIINGQGEVQTKLIETNEKIRNDYSEFSDINKIENTTTDKELLLIGGSIIEVKGVAQENWNFSNWEGYINSENNPIQIEVDGDVNLTANFVESTTDTVYYTLNWSTNGGGNINEKLLSGSKDNGNYSEGSEIELEAVADNGWEFTSWSGDIDSSISSQNPITITMNSNYSVEANFSEIVSDGDINISGNISINHNWPYSKTYDNPVSSSSLDSIVVAKDIEEKEGEYIEGEMIIGFNRIVVASQQQEVLNKLGFEVKSQQTISNSYLVKIKEENAQEAIAKAKAENGVRFAEPNYIYQAFSTVPNDEYLGYQWHYPQIRLPQAWDSTTGSSLVRIAVLDTGIDSQHPDLQNNLDLEDGYNFPAQSTDTNDQYGHGTHVTGTIAADTNNSLGVAGVMWEAEVVPVKVLGDDGYGSNWDIAQGILYAAGLTDDPQISKSVDVISMSLGGSSDSQTISEAVTEAANTGVIIVAAAGNSNTTSPMYPAAYPEVISVGAVDFNSPNAPIRAPYSCYGDTLDVMAPGGNTIVDSDNNGYADGVLSTTFEGSGDNKTYRYIYYQGTSMATPHVSGLIGLMLANGIPRNQIREVLRETSFDLGDPGFDSEFGYGLVNAYWALNQVQSIRIFAGERDGDNINEEVEISIGLRDRSYNIGSITGGNYAIFGWIDVNGNDIIDSGDYLAESEPQTFEEGNYQVDLNLEEIE
ncbi:MAG TPA: S8 family serine peptidase [Halanaerobiales bacterium]|nr:S8 family serine peptidase [Halanaerobiales bacterium]